MADQRTNLNQCLRAWLALAGRLTEAIDRHDDAEIVAVLELRAEVLNLVQRVGLPPRGSSGDPDQVAETDRLSREIDAAEVDILRRFDRELVRLSTEIGESRRALSAAANLRSMGESSARGRTVDDYR